MTGSLHPGSAIQSPPTHPPNHPNHHPNNQPTNQSIFELAKSIQRVIANQVNEFKIHYHMRLDGA
jgi:hypothetical protein